MSECFLKVKKGGGESFILDSRVVPYLNPLLRLAFPVVINVLKIIIHSSQYRVRIYLASMVSL